MQKSKILSIQTLPEQPHNFASCSSISSFSSLSSQSTADLSQLGDDEVFTKFPEEYIPFGNSFTNIGFNNESEVVKPPSISLTSPNRRNKHTGTAV